MSSQANKVQVSISTADDGQERVIIAMEGAQDAVCNLTPSQARALATELISAVNRAEVKANLKVSPNLWRRSGEPQPRLVAAG